MRALSTSFALNSDSIAMVRRHLSRLRSVLDLRCRQPDKSSTAGSSTSQAVTPSDTQADQSASACPEALLEHDVLVCILRELSHGESGLDLRRWMTCGRVCKAWARAIQEVPAAVTFTNPLTDEQYQRLCTTPLSITSISFSETDTRAISLLSDSGFQERNSASLRIVCNLGMSACDPPSALQPYNLRVLHLSNPKLRPSSNSFSSLIFSHMSNLEVLSLRNYAALKLDGMPTSVHTLQVGPADISWHASHRLERIIVSSNGDLWLCRGLSPYFAHARCVNAFAERIIMMRERRRGPGPDNWTPNLRPHSPSVLEELTLEFGNVVVCAPPSGSRSSNVHKGIEMMQQSLGPAEFVVTEGAGRLFPYRAKLNALHKQQRLRFAEGC